MVFGCLDVLDDWDTGGITLQFFISRNHQFHNFLNFNFSTSLKTGQYILQNNIDSMCACAL